MRHRAVFPYTADERWQYRNFKGINDRSLPPWGLGSNLLFETRASRGVATKEDAVAAGTRKNQEFMQSKGQGK